MIEDIAQSTQLALDFLKIIYPQGPWTISSIIDNPDPDASNPVLIRGRTFHERQLGDLERYLKDRNGQVNLYWQINPLRCDPGNKAHLQDVRAITRFHVDLDPRKGTHDREAERLLIRELLDDEPRLRDLGLPGLPTCVIDSGNGYWGFWDLAEPLSISGETIEERREQAAEYGRYNRWVAEVFNEAFNAGLEGIEKEVGDTCHNVDRIARLPFTLNIPDERKRAAGYAPIQASLYSRHPDRLYSAEQFQKSEVISWGASATQAELQRIEVGQIQRTLPDSNDPWEIAEELGHQYPQIGQKTLELICLGEYIEEGAGDDNIHDKLTPQGLSVNRSRAHWRVNRSLQQYGVPLNVILGILCDERLPISAHAREPIDDRSGKRGARRSGRELIQFNEIQIRKCAASIAKQQAEEAKRQAAEQQAEDVLTKERPPSGENKADAKEPEAGGPKKKEPSTVSEVLRELNSRHAVLLQEGGKTLVLSWEATEVDPNREAPVLQTFTDFKNRYCNRLVEVGLNRDNQPILKSWGEVWLNHPRRREFFGLRFYPGREETVNGYLNMWRGWPVEPKEGDWSLMKKHIYDVLAGGNEDYFNYIMNWAANAVQHPELPAEVALVFRGGRGTGKGVFARALKAMFGQHGLQILSSNHITGKFNAHLRDCCLLFADEAIRPGNKDGESILKGLITEPEIPIERKRIDLSPARNHLHIIMASNEEWVIPAGIDERRFAIFDVNSTHQQERSYFEPLHKQILSEAGLAAMLHELLHRDIKDWHPRYDVPQTSALKEQKKQGLSPFDQFILNILEEGELPGPTFTGHPTTIYSQDRKNELGLYSRIKQSSPRLRDTSYQTFGAKLREWGCRNATNGTRRGWYFPPLDEMRLIWDEKYWQHDWPLEITSWIGDNGQTENIDEEMPF